MFAWLARLIDRFFVVSGAFLFSQIPAFLQQYSQRLAGHLAELDHQLGGLQRLALQSGKSLHDYIHKFTSSSDIDFSRQGALMLDMIERQVAFSDAFTHLSQASTWMRPVEFIKYLQWEVMWGTARNFQPGLSLTIEGILYALLGMLVGYAIYASISRFLRLLTRPFRRAEKPIVVATPETKLPTD